jgi:DNA mismatch endonuclease (patch repair protein)
VLFVDGCFWHGCTLHYQRPKNNETYWLSKLTANRRRDQNVNTKLQEKGWTVIRIWEHTVKEINHADERCLLPRELQELLQLVNLQS